MTIPEVWGCTFSKSVLRGQTRVWMLERIFSQPTDYLNHGIT